MANLATGADWPRQPSGDALDRLFDLRRSGEWA